MAKKIDIKQIVKDYHDFVADTKEKYMTFLKDVLKTTENNIIRFEQGLKIDFNGGVVLFKSCSAPLVISEADAVS